MTSGLFHKQSAKNEATMSKSLLLLFESLRKLLFERHVKGNRSVVLPSIMEGRGPGLPFREVLGSDLDPETGYCH
jgi:hypothetical protein